MAFPSTFVDLQNAVAAKARIDTSADLQKVKDWINQVYAHICNETECLQQAATMALTSGSASYTLPSAIVRIKQIIIQPSGQTAYWPPLVETSLEDILRKRGYGGSSLIVSGSATHYALAGLNQLELWPTPASADTMEVYYSYAPTALSGDTDVPLLGEPWNAKLLEYGAMVEATDYMGDFISNSVFAQRYEIWLQRFRLHLNRRRGGHTGQLAVAGQRPAQPRDRSIDIRTY